MLNMYHVFRRTAVLACILTFVSCLDNSEDLVNRDSNVLGWKSVYKHDTLGNPINGSMDGLIEGIRKGYEVRIGWGWKKTVGDSIVTVEHIAAPVFLSIIQEKHVSAVIDPHPLLQSYLDMNRQILNSNGEIWQCVITTEGKFNAKVFNKTTGELIKDWPQRHRITWFLDVNNSDKNKSETLFN